MSGLLRQRVLLLTNLECRSRLAFFHRLLELQNLCNGRAANVALYYTNRLVCSRRCCVLIPPATCPVLSITMTPTTSLPLILAWSAYATSREYKPLRTFSSSASISRKCRCRCPRPDQNTSDGISDVVISGADRTSTNNGSNSAHTFPQSTNVSGTH